MVPAPCAAPNELVRQIRSRAPGIVRLILRGSLEGTSSSSRQGVYGFDAVSSFSAHAVSSKQSRADHAALSIDARLADKSRRGDDVLGGWQLSCRDRRLPPEERVEQPDRRARSQA